MRHIFLLCCVFITFSGFQFSPAHAQDNALTHQDLIETAKPVDEQDLYNHLVNKTLWNPIDQNRYFLGPDGTLMIQYFQDDPRRGVTRAQIVEGLWSMQGGNKVCLTLPSPVMSENNSYIDVDYCYNAYEATKIPRPFGVFDEPLILEFAQQPGTIGLVWNRWIFGNVILKPDQVNGYFADTARMDEIVATGFTKDHIATPVKLETLTPLMREYAGKAMGNVMELPLAYAYFGENGVFKAIEKDKLENKTLSNPDTLNAIRAHIFKGRWFMRDHIHCWGEPEKYMFCSAVHPGDAFYEPHEDGYLYHANFHHSWRSYPNGGFTPIEKSPYKSLFLEE